MTLLAGVDLNASRVRAVAGPAKAPPQTVALEAPMGPELPLALSLEGRRVAVGESGIQLCRRLPHLACHKFLPHLGGERQWHAGRHQLNADQALSHVLKHVQPALSHAVGLAVVLPSYLTRSQRNLVGELLKQAKLPLLGTVTAPLAAIWAVRAPRPWHGLAVILDVDDHALVWTAVAVDAHPAAPEARVVGQRVVPALGLHAWKERLLDGIADRCIRHSRRDPRATGATEQALYEQLDRAMESSGQGRLVELVIQSENWYQDLVLKPGEIVGYSAALVRPALTELRRLLAAANQPVALVAATASAARLPGLLRALHQHSEIRTQQVTLTPGALAQAAHELAGKWFDGALPRGPIDTAIPVKPVPRARAQPVRTPSPSQPTRLPPRKGSVEKAVRSEDDFSVGIDE
ncbi:hypothetical protein AYO44_02350 [Planctomycetaceae bacterium SCGC AG-212-F19]|nr:hypothetical protein AYO44_02350 [Planctomycetaceae bacterium SCGC AG-212-F19]